MKLPSGKRLGQSGHELALAVFFSFFLHAAVVFAAMYLYFSVVPETHAPLFYKVALVAPPAETLPAPNQNTAPTPQQNSPKTEAKPKATAVKKARLKRALKAARKAISAAAKKEAIPELAPQKPAPEPEHEKPREKGPVTTAGAPTPLAGKTAAVAVETQQQDFKYSWYLSLVTNKIRQNWFAPPDAANAKVRVIFSINSSGWVSPKDVSIDEKNSIGTYGFKLAAVRAILSSKPFPRLPEDYPKPMLELSVDLAAE